MISKDLKFVFIIAISLNLAVQAKTQDFKTLKSLISARNQEPKVYLPSYGFMGSQIEISVIAPGAKKIILLASNQPGQSVFNGVDIKLANNYQEIGNSNASKANFKINLDPRSNNNELLKGFDYSGQQANNLYFEALAMYQDDQGKEIFKPALFYGANANFTNQNLVEIKLPAKDGASVSSMARNFLPGLMRAGSGNAVF
jgi:hypothetical protein